MALVTLPLSDGATLDVGLRAGESRLAPADARVLAMLAGPLSVAVSATRAAGELQLARERLITAREEERRRLRRDLHDGLGTLLTGVVLSADAAANTSLTRPEESATLLAGVRSDLRSAVHEVRRLVDDLRPVAVDELGLVPALEVRAAQTVRRADGARLEVTVETDLDQPLPAALEVAAYRIATEAVTNVVRHADASRATIRVRVRDGALEVEVCDDGHATAWGSGVGTASMRERAEELGGTCERGPGPRRRPGACPDPDRNVVIRVLVVDDHPVMRHGLAALLGSLAGITVVSEADNGKEAVREAVLHRPDVVLLDLQMPGTDGFSALRELSRLLPATAVCVLTMFSDDDSLFAAMRAGARGYLLKGAEQEDIERAVRGVAAGEAVFGPGVAQRVLAQLTAPPPRPASRAMMAACPRSTSWSLVKMLDTTLPIVLGDNPRFLATSRGGWPAASRSRTSFSRGVRFGNGSGPGSAWGRLMAQNGGMSLTGPAVQIVFILPTPPTVTA